MDRLARIGAGWFVTCVVGGAAVIAAGILAPADYVLLRAVLMVAGALAIVVGISGIVAETVVMLRGHSGPPTLLNMAPEGLAAYFKDHTEVQAKGLVAPYLGEWIQVTREVSDVVVRPLYYVVSMGSSTAQGRVHVIARFGRKWVPHLRRLRKGEPVTVVGRVESVGQFVVVLKDSQIVP